LSEIRPNLPQAWYSEQMIAIILAGRYATRLYPLTRNTAKPLLPIKGKAIIDHTLEKIVELEEIDHIIVATNRRFERQFKEWLSHRPCGNVTIRAENSLEEKDKLGTIRALAEIAEEVDAKDYLIIAGDNLFTSNLKDFVQGYQKKKNPTIAIHDVKAPELAKAYSVVKIDEERKIISFKEKPERLESSLIGTCIYLLPKPSLKRIHEYLQEGNNPDSPGHFIEWLSKKEPVQAHILQGLWWDIGTPRSYREAKGALEKG
jgi:glucose-1-phosphate thymidylyltransferase